VVKAGGLEAKLFQIPTETSVMLTAARQAKLPIILF
jgi:hypothetical protein